MDIDERMAHEATIRNMQDEDYILQLKVPKPMLNKGISLAVVLNVVIIILIFMSGEDILAGVIMALVLISMFIFYREQKKYHELHSKARSIIDYYRNKTN